MCVMDLWRCKDKAKCVEWGVKCFAIPWENGNSFTRGKALYIHIKLRIEETLEVLNLGTGLNLNSNIIAGLSAP